VPTGLQSQGSSITCSWEHQLARGSTPPRVCALGRGMESGKFSLSVFSDSVDWAAASLKAICDGGAAAFASRLQQRPTHTKAKAVREAYCRIIAIHPTPSLRRALEKVYCPAQTRCTLEEI